VCFHLKRKFMEVVMEGRGKWGGRGERGRGGTGEVREKGFRDNAYQIDEYTVLALTLYFGLFLTGRVGRIEASSTFFLPIQKLGLTSVSLPSSTRTRPSTALC
jgi:hypothetical protein